MYSGGTGHCGGLFHCHVGVGFFHSTVVVKTLMRELDDLPTPAPGGDGDHTRGAYRRAKGWRNKITEAEVQEAVRVFKAKGGIIEKLPDEIVSPCYMVGWLYGVYETIFGGNPND